MARSMRLGWKGKAGLEIANERTERRGGGGDGHHQSEHICVGLLTARWSGCDSEWCVCVSEHAALTAPQHDDVLRGSCGPRA